MGNLEEEGISDALDKLSEVQRRRLLMLADGMSIREIARVEGVKHTPVLRSVERARKIFKERDPGTIGKERANPPLSG